MPVIAYLKDHKAATLDAVSSTVEKYIADNPVADGGTAAGRRHRGHRGRGQP